MRAAVVEPFSGDYYTQAKKETTTAIVQLYARSPARPPAFFGRVVTEQVVGYQKKSIQTQESIEPVPLISADGVRNRGDLVPARAAAEGLEEMPNCHGRCTRPALADRAAAAWAMCDRWDLGLDEPAFPDRRADDLHDGFRRVGITDAVQVSGLGRRYQAA
jgi:hypothetical protein